MTRWLKALLIAFLLAWPGIALAVQPDEVLDDPVLEERARSISGNLRCLVCQNQSIDDSDAELARDLRILVRERLVAGDSDQEVYDYVVARYGEFVLLRPVIGLHTILLWVAAPALLMIGLVAVLIGAMRRRRVQTGTSQLSPEEQKALDRLSKS
ncbi:cytochrome c-type biogenesis protein [Pelagibacterium halotolerans]|uniref:cytochrome c-type biogenesis protein n=1 Tax=Pelagibacterium halotolerans TaxID=531813 RepID=UPI00384AAFC8